VKNLIRVAVLGLALAILSPVLRAAPPKSAGHAFQLTDLRKLVRLSDPQISPDGRKVALVVSHWDWKNDKSRPAIVLVDVTTGKRRTLTWKRKGIGNLQWSHDGSRLAFIAPDSATAKTSAAGAEKAASDKRPKPQVFVMPMNGGDPVPVTHAERGVAGYAWSPDDRRIAYVAEDPAPNARAASKHNGAFRVTSNNFLLRKPLGPWHLWVVASDGGKAIRLTHGKFSLNTDQQDHPPNPTWSADGKAIGFVRFPGPYWGPSFHSVADIVPSTGGKPRTLVPSQGVLGLRFAPGSNRYAYLRPRGGDQNNGNAVYVGHDGHDRDVTAAMARNINSYAWLPGRGSLLLTGDLGTDAVMWHLPLDGKARRLHLGDIQVRGPVSVSRNGEVAFLGSTPRHPDELYVMNVSKPAPRRLTDLNGFVDSLALGRVRAITWNGPDGFHEDGVLTYPVGFHAGRRYPLVLVIHGGPEGASGVGFSPLPQLLSAAGFLVFQPNYRGSINLGDAYQHAIYRDTGEGPGRDVMAGLAAVEKLGIVDTSRIGVSGWSYGGYMTAWLSSHYDVWRAAVAGAALTDWVMDYTIAYYQTGDTYFFGGSPWVAKYHDIWREQSPITHAQHVKAPTLIMGDVGDPNVPLVNSYEWYHALRDNGVKVEFYAYPADTHFPPDIVQQTDVMRRWVGWMKQYLR